MAIRWRFIAAEFSDLGRQLKPFAWFGAKLALMPVMRFSIGQRLSNHLGELTVDPAEWPRTERLLVEFGKSLQPVMPPGVVIRDPQGRSFSIAGSRPQFGGFVGMGGHADMPQSTPRNLARDLKQLMRGISKVLQPMHPEWPTSSTPPPAFKTKADGEFIHMWWEDADGQVAVQLPDLDLRAAGLA